MKIFFDTSVLGPALIKVMPNHPRAAPWLERVRTGQDVMVVSNHNLAELYSFLSRIPLKPPIPALAIWKLIAETVLPLSEVVTLTVTDYRETIERMATAGLTGGIVYDALIARAAEKAKVDKLVTFNVAHFREVWPEGGTRFVAP